jgi:putative nucleotidyltransferase with HDIG domain
LKQKKDILKIFLIGFFALGAVLAVVWYFPHIPSALNDLPSWYLYRFFHVSAKELKIIGIEIDDNSLSKVSDNRWPWKRSEYAKVLDILNNEGVKTVGLDLVFQGKSDDEDDARLKQALQSFSKKPVIGAAINQEEGSSSVVTMLPLAMFRDSAWVGIVNTPTDKDGKARRLRSHIDLPGYGKYYSLVVLLAASYLDRSPETIDSSLVLREDKSFFVDYVLHPEDVKKRTKEQKAKVIGYYDVVNSLDILKKEFGNGFLKDSLVLIYPAAEIIHDIGDTPLGKMPGGFLHLNGVADILLGRTVRESHLLSWFFLLCSCAAVYYILRCTGVLTGFLFTFGFVVAVFWALVFSRLHGVQFDFALTALFSVLFFISGSVYKYLYFLTRLLKIKDKATIDPLRGVYTLRFFYYRLELELEKIYFSKELFLVFFYLESLKGSTGTMSVDSIKNIWRHITPILASKSSFWALYSPEELAGGVVCAKKEIAAYTRFLKNNLQMVFNDEHIGVSVKAGYVKIKKEYPVKELLFLFSSEVRRKGGDAFYLQENDLAPLLHPSHLMLKEKGGLLENLDEDIEEMNRQLLSFIENLNHEQERSRESFFEIIASLVKAVETRDPYTEGHSERVSRYSLLLADKLGWNAEEKEKLKKAGLLHDLGKIGIPDHILHKKERLTDEEYDFIKKHTIISVKILEPLKDLKEIVPWIMYHHERWDGKGYPHGLGGNAIPVAAQIIAVADSYDAITTGRDYKAAVNPGDALRELAQCGGTQFNPHFVELFSQAMLEQLQK